MLFRTPFFLTFTLVRIRLSQACLSYILAAVTQSKSAITVTVTKRSLAIAWSKFIYIERSFGAIIATLIPERKVGEWVKDFVARRIRHRRRVSCWQWERCRGCGSGCGWWRRGQGRGRRRGNGRPHESPEPSFDEFLGQHISSFGTSLGSEMGDLAHNGVAVTLGGSVLYGIKPAVNVSLELTSHDTITFPSTQNVEATTPTVGR